MIETELDTRAMIDKNEFADLIYLGANINIFGILDHNYDQSMDINGRTTVLRCYYEDVNSVAIGSTLKHVRTDTTYTVRAKENGARTTLLILEQT